MIGQKVATVARMMAGVRKVAAVAAMMAGVSQKVAAVARTMARVSQKVAAVDAAVAVPMSRLLLEALQIRFRGRRCAMGTVAERTTGMS